jgi:hypothetical protein
MGGLRSNFQHHGKVIASTPPQVRTIFWNGNSRGEQFIFPHTLFVAYYTRNEGGHKAKYWLNRLHVGFSLNPIDLKNDQQPIYGLPLANTDVGNAICFYQWPVSEDPLDFMKQVISQYWLSPFTDYGDSFSHWLNTYNVTSDRVSRPGTFREDWKRATARRDWQWLWKQNLYQAPYCVNLRQTLLSNKTQTDETDWFPNLGVPVPRELIQRLAEQKWNEAGCPDGDDNRFWLAAEKELKEQLHAFK